MLDPIPSQLACRSVRTARAAFARRATRFLGVLLLGCVLAAPAEAKEKHRSGKPADAARLHFDANYFQGRRVQIDGSFMDWADVPPVSFETLTAGEYEYDWTGPEDLSAQVKVQHNDDELFVYIKVLDNVLTAPKKGKKGDEIDIWLDVGELAGKKDRFRRLTIDPSYLLDNNDKPDAFWDTPRSMRDKPITTLGLAGYAGGGGYEVEVSIPFADFSPAPPTFAPMGFCVVVRDFDQDDPNEDEASVASCPFVHKTSSKWRSADLGTVRWSTKDNVWQGIVDEYPELADAKTLRASGDVGGDARSDQVIVAGGKLFVLGLGLGPGEWYAYDLGVATGDSIESLELVEADKDANLEIAITKRRLFNAGQVKIEQDLVSVFGFIKDEGITDPLVSIEVANRLVGGDDKVTNTLKFRKGKIVQSIADVSGWDKDTYLDADGGFHDDYWPILVPWLKPKARTFTAESDGTFSSK